MNHYDSCAWISVPGHDNSFYSCYVFSSKSVSFVQTHQWFPADLLENQSKQFQAIENCHTVHRVSTLSSQTGLQSMWSECKSMLLFI